MGSKIAYYLFIYPISKLPYPLLYGLSNFLFFLIYRLIGYRKEVVLNNIKQSFPEKSKEEHEKIMKDFYRHFCDFILESIKSFTLSKEEALKRFKLLNPEVVDEIYEEGKDIIFVGGHYNNWEILAISIGMQMKTLPFGIYKPLSNKFFDRIVRESRERYRLKLCPVKEVKDMITTDFGEPKGTIFAVDQSPSNPTKSYWTTFLNQETAMLFGAEKYAKELNLPVVFCRIDKTKRGYYTGTMKVVCYDPSKTEYGEITQLCNIEVEKQVQEDPQYWLWSHKRWKHKRPKDATLHKRID